MMQKQSPYKIHKTKDLIETIRELTRTCDVATASWAIVYPTSQQTDDASEEGRLLVVQLSKQQTKIQKQNRIHVLAVFGEHGRERITSEIGLDMIRQACKGNPTNAISAALVRGHIFTLIPVVNVDGRRIAEEKDDCKRGNLKGVDLNRNFPFGWARNIVDVDKNNGLLQRHDNKSMYSDREEENPGMHPLSEWETRALIGVLQKERVDGYVSVHSGGRAVVIPWDCVNDEESDAVKQIGEDIAKKHCKGCKVGNAEKVLQYHACGTGMDFGRELGLRFATTLEVYKNDVDSCNLAFNPGIGTDRERVVKEWSNVLVTVAQGIDKMPMENKWKWKRLKCRQYGYYVVFEKDDGRWNLEHDLPSIMNLKASRAGMECRYVVIESMIIVSIQLMAMIMLLGWIIMFVVRRKQD